MSKTDIPLLTLLSLFACSCAGESVWITSSEFAGRKPRNVFHRQLDPGFGSAAETNDRDHLNRHILFRRAFDLSAVPAAARLRISADDSYRLFINGKAVGQGPAPGYPDRMFMNEYDAAPYLRPGRNVIAVHTLYQGLVNRVFVSADGRHGLWLELSDGTGRNLVESDASFRCALHTGYTALGMAGYQTQFLERYDARAPEVGFERIEYDDARWENAKPRTHVDYVFAPEAVQPAVQVGAVAPVRTERRGRTLWIDFGAIYVGTLALKARGRDEIRLRFGQELNTDGSVRWRMRCNCDYAEIFQLSGRTEGDALESFDYKSFRFAEIDVPDDAAVDESSIALMARHRPFRLKARCSYDDGIRRGIFNLCAESLHWGVQETIQDCMDREKGYYLGDGCYSLWAYYLMTRDGKMLRKFVDDFLHTSFITPGLVTCGCCSFMQEIAEYPFCLIQLVWHYACTTGDWAFVRERYAALAAALDFYRRSYAEKDGLLNNLDKWCVVEWPANSRDGYDVDIAEGKVCRTKHNAVNAQYIGAVKCLNRLANGIGYAPFADEAALKRSFVAAFYDPERRLFRDSVASRHVSLPGNTYAAFFGLFPDEAGERELVEWIARKGFRGSLPYQTVPILGFLERRGETDLVRRLITDERFWPRRISVDCTRTPEAYPLDLKWNTSLFHLTLTEISIFLTDWNRLRAFAFQDSR